MRRARRGTTLVEAMVALALLAMGILGLVRGVIMASQSDRVARGRTLAGALANDLIVYLQNQSFDSTLLANTSTSNDGTTHSDFITGKNLSTGKDTFAVDPDHRDAELPADYPGVTAAELGAIQGADGSPVYNYGFERYWNVAPDPTNPNPSSPVLKLISITVSFNNGAGGRNFITQHVGVYDKSRLNMSLSGGVPML